LAGPPPRTNPQTVAEILASEVREIPRYRTIPQGSANTLVRETISSAHGSKQDRHGKCRVSGVEGGGLRVGCRVSSAKLRSTGVLEFWSNGFRKRFFHHSTTPILHHSNLLPMTNRAARETFDFVLPHELLPECNLIRRGLPVHAEDLLPRPYKALRVAMAF